MRNAGRGDVGRGHGGRNGRGRRDGGGGGRTGHNDHIERFCTPAQSFARNREVPAARAGRGGHTAGRSAARPVRADFRPPRAQGSTRSPVGRALPLYSRSGSRMPQRPAGSAARSSVLNIWKKSISPRALSVILGMKSLLSVRQDVSMRHRRVHRGGEHSKARQ